MSIARAFMTTTEKDSPLDGTVKSTNTTQVSDFLSVQSLTNFAAMTGGIAAAWRGLELLGPCFATKWVPFGFVIAFAFVSIASSWAGLKKDDKFHLGTFSGAVLIGVINSLVLYGAVMAASGVTGL